MDIIEDKIEVACCRVCHGESEPDNQLFFPCKCDGSIKYVHQECLIQWLKVSNKKKCELCGEEFHFQKVYKSGAPYHISLIDIVVELLPKILGMIQYSFVVSFAMIMWGVFLPLFTNWCLKFCWCIIVDSDENCMMNIPTFIKEGSVEGGLNYWYFGLVDVCIIVAASIVAFEILDTLRREYRLANNNYQIRQLERRLAENRTVLRNYEKEDLQREQMMFAVADYESMKTEWDKSKKQYSDTILRTKTYINSKQEENNSSNNTNDQLYEEIQETIETSSESLTNVNSASLLPAEPSLEDRFLMVQSLANDYEYCIKIVQRLHIICSCPTSPATSTAISSFQPILLSYTKLLEELEKTNTQCAELIGLLPSSLVPMKSDIGKKNTYPVEFQDAQYTSSSSGVYSRTGVSNSYRDYWQEMHEIDESESDLMNNPEESFKFSKLGARKGDLLEDDEEGDQQLMQEASDRKVSHQFNTAAAMDWNEREEGVNVDSTMPSMDNLELRANMILRRRLREEAAVARMVIGTATPTQLKQQWHTGDEGSVWTREGMEQMPANTCQDTAIAAATTAAADVYISTADNCRDTAYSEQTEESIVSSGGLRGDHCTVDPNLEIAMHSIEDYTAAQSGWEELDKLQCDVALYCDDDQETDTSSDSHSSASHTSTSLALSQDLKNGIKSQTGVVSGGYDIKDSTMQSVFVQQDNIDEVQCVSDQLAVEGVGMEERKVSTEGTQHNRDSIDVPELSAENSNGTILESSIQHAIGQTGGAGGDLPVPPMPVQHTADLAPIIAADEAAFDLPIQAAEGDIDQVAVDPAVIPVPAPEAPLVVPGPAAGIGAGGARANNQFFSLENIAIAYGYVTVFVVASVLFPAILGHILLLLCGLGSALADVLRSAAYEVVGHEDSFLHVLKLFDSFEDSRELLTAVAGTEGDVAARLHATDLISAHLLALTKLGIGYILLIFAAGITFIGYYIHFMGTFEPFHFNINARGNITEVLQRNSQAIVDIVSTAMKITLIVSVFAGVFPTILTILTAKFMNKSLPAYMRSDDSTNLPIILIFGLFVFSNFISAHIWYITLEMRRVIDRKYLIGIIPSAEHLEDNINNNHTFLEIHEKLKAKSFPSIVKNFMIRISILLPAFLFCVVVPIRWGHLLCPLEGPLLFRLKQGSSELQIPVEMMLSHIFIPLIIEKMRYRAVVKNVTGAFFTWTAPMLGLDWILAVDPTIPAAAQVPAVHLPNEQPGLEPGVIDPAVHEQPVEPLPESAVALDDGESNEIADEVIRDNNSPADNVLPARDAVNSLLPAQIDPVQQEANPAQHHASSVLQVWLRLSILGVLGLFTLAVVSSWALHAPLAAGRCVLHLFHMPTHNDLFNYPVGLLICWGLCFVGYYIVQDVSRHAGIRSAFTATIKWIALAGKVLGVGILWLGLPPLLIGVLLEALIIAPIRLPVTETPFIPFLQNWALGMIILKAFSKCVLNGMFGENDLRIQMEMVLIRGFAQFDAVLCLRRIVWPITQQLLDLLLIPFFCARLACVLTSSYLLRTIMMRYCYHTYVLTIIAGYALRHTVHALIKMHNEVRDSKYLVGTRLTNRS